MKNTSVKVRKKIKVSADAVWDTISAIGGVDKWLSMIQTCRFEGSGAGATRVCTTADGLTLNERIEKVDHTNRVFEYSIPEAPLPVQDLFGTMKVHETADSSISEIEWSATFGVEEVHEAEIVGMLKTIYTEGIDGLERLHQQ
ncbi:MAG: SRPBCC family protein [Nitrospiria bacterium]